MAKAPSIVVLTGAGISAESGVPTFRGPDGLWEGHRVEDVATPQAFARNPDLVHSFYNARRAALGKVHPNAAHLALAHLERELDAQGGSLLVVTQNVDDLHERAGSTRLIHMHGELRSGWCRGCDNRTRWLADMDIRTQCPSCGRTGLMRADIVWFGEMPYQMEEIEDALAQCDLFVSIGTSGNVYPAAGFVSMVRHVGIAETLELNLEPTGGSSLFHQTRHGPAGQIVPHWVDEVLSSR